MTAGSQPVLAAESLDVFLGASHVLRGVDFRLMAGETVALLGRNGMGKTTLLRTLMGLVLPRRGRIAVNGVDVTDERPSARAQSGLAFVPEDRGIFPNLTVAENLSFAAHPIPAAPNRTAWTVAAVEQLFPALAERRRHWGHQLSGGEQKMLAIGRALMANPSILLLDEATEGLAPLVREQIWATLRAVRAAGIATVVVDRNIDHLLALADRHVILAKGAVVFEGSGADLRRHPEIIHRHLGL
jgi:branched-chain amino acid transport system ATP-binding protein